MTVCLAYGMAATVEAMYLFFEQCKIYSYAYKRCMRSLISYEKITKLKYISAETKMAFFCGEDFFFKVSHDFKVFCIDFKFYSIEDLKDAALNCLWPVMLYFHLDRLNDPYTSQS